MVNPNQPPFRADHVGSLLRPKRLVEAREKMKKSELSTTALKALEDEAIREVVKIQEEIGLHGVTDGDFRRDHWWVDFIEAIDGVAMERLAEEALRLPPEPVTPPGVAARFTVVRDGAPLDLDVALVPRASAGLLAGGIAWRTTHANRQWSAALARLDTEPGIAVIRSERSDGKWRITGMRDPLAVNPSLIMASRGVDTNDVVAHWEPYVSTEPALLLGDE